MARQIWQPGSCLSGICGLTGRLLPFSVICRSPFEEQMTIVRREEGAARNVEEAAVGPLAAKLPGIGSSDSSTWKTRLKAASPAVKGVLTAEGFALMTARLA